MVTIDQLQKALEGAQAVMRSVGPDDLAKPSACAGWDNKALANHMTGVCYMFGRAAGGEKITAYGEMPDLVGNDPAGAYAKSIEAALVGWRTEGATEGTVTLPHGEMPAGVALSINMIDQLLHTWDLAKGVGREVELDPELMEAAMAGLQMIITPERRGEGKPFGAEVQVGPDASLQERLLAFSGRQP